MPFCPLDLRRFLWLAAVVPLAVGCGRGEPITRYTVPKPELINPEFHRPAGTSGPAVAAVPQQTLGAIVLVEDAGWFFKLVGDPELVQPVRDEFVEFVKSVRFAAGPSPTPTWTLPEGWKELPGNEFRHATIVIPADGQALELELAISRLGKSSDFPDDDYLLANVNRWREQMGLGPIQAGDLSSETETLQAGGRDVVLVDIVGTGRPGGMMGPFAGGAAPRSSGPAVASAPDADSPIDFKAPSEWTAVRPKAFSLATFMVVEDGKNLDVTVSTAGGDRLANVNRWRSQVGLSPWSADEMASEIEKIETLGTTGDYVELVGRETTILGVIAQAGGDQWFIKLTGDSSLAEREKDRFEAFVKSLRLK